MIYPLDAYVAARRMGISRFKSVWFEMLQVILWGLEKR